MYYMILACVLIGSCLARIDIALANDTSQHITAGSRPLPSAIWSGNTRVRRVLEPTDGFNQAETYEAMQGGAGTHRKKPDRNAYSHQTSTLGFEGLQHFKLGNALFNKFLGILTFIDPGV